MLNHDKYCLKLLITLFTSLNLIPHLSAFKNSITQKQTYVLYNFVELTKTKKLDSRFRLSSKSQSVHTTRTVSTSGACHHISTIFMLLQYLVVDILLFRIRLLLCLLGLRMSWIHLRLELYAPCQLKALLRSGDPQLQLEGS